VTKNKYNITENNVAYLAVLLSLNGILLYVFSTTLSNGADLVLGLMETAQIVIGFLYLSFVPGAIFLLYFDYRSGISRFLLYSLGISMVFTMVFGALSSILEIEFSSTVFVGLHVAFVTVASLVLIRERGNQIVTSISYERSLKKQTIILLTLPLLAIIGVELIENQGTNFLALMYLLVTSLIPIYSVMKETSDRDYLVIIFAISLSLLYYSSLFGPSVKGPAISALTLIEGFWEPTMGAVKGKEAVLPNGVLYPTYVVFTGMSLESEVALLNPMIVSAIPLSLFISYRTWFEKRLSVLSVLIFMYSFPYFNLYPRGDRVSTPVIFLSLMILVFADTDLPRRLSRILSLLFVAGLVVSHYGTSYLVMFAIIGSVFLYRTLVLLKDEKTKPVLLRMSFIAFVIAGNLFWYTYTSGGIHVESLFVHMIKEVQGLLELELGGTGTETLTESFGSFSIRWARRLFIIFGALMSLGIATTAIQKVLSISNQLVETVSDEYLSLAGAFILLIGASFLPGAGGFNIARIMMIVFTICLPFIFIGTYNILNRFLGWETGKKPMYISLASVVTIFFLLNSGFASATVSDDYGPNTIAIENRLANEETSQRFQAQGCLSCDLEAHLWTQARTDKDATIYADQLAVGQTDAYRMALTLELGYFPLENRYTFLEQRESAENFYILLLSHNTDTGLALSSDKGAVYDYSVSDGKLSKIYATGSSIVRYNNSIN
jgi:uncharacterized membrane protein